MANEKNLKRVKAGEEARELGRRGGIASGRARREKRSLRQRLELALSMRAEGDFEGDRADLICAALISRAEKGDISAFTAIRDSIGEKPGDKFEHSGRAGGPIDHRCEISPEILDYLKRKAEERK